MLSLVRPRDPECLHCQVPTIVTYVAKTWNSDDSSLLPCGASASPPLAWKDHVHTEGKWIAYFDWRFQFSSAERKYAPFVVFAASSGVRRRPTQVCLLQCFFNNLIRKPKIRTHHSCEVSLPPFAERRLNGLVLYDRALVRSLVRRRFSSSKQDYHRLPSRRRAKIPHYSFQIAQCVEYKRSKRAEWKFITPHAPWMSKKKYEFESIKRRPKLPASSENMLPTIGRKFRGGQNWRNVDRLRSKWFIVRGWRLRPELQKPTCCHWLARTCTTFSSFQSRRFWAESLSYCTWLRKSRIL